MFPDVDGEPVQCGIPFAQPPLTSLLRVSAGVLGPHAPLCCPYVIAVDPSGALLLATSGPFPGVDSPSYPPASLRLVRLQPPDSDHTFDDYIFTVANVPGSFSPPIVHLGNVGLISLRGGNDGDYMVAELQPIEDCDRARMIYVHTHTEEWAEKEISYPVPLPHRAWGRHGVISHGGKLWWVDLSWGLLSCDPCANEPVLLFEELPEGKRARVRRSIYTVATNR